jgi:hypothetical protein
MIEFVVGVLLAAAAVWFVLRPIFSPLSASALARGLGAPFGAGDADDPDDDSSPQAVALRALREIEFDRATGKLSDADYDAMHRKYTAEALAAMRGAPRDPGVNPPVAAPRASRVPPPACATHGPRPEPDAAFCSECGRRLARASGYCARCGHALETEARYCHACGSRVAA